jgi:hypothetical protein
MSFALFFEIMGTKVMKVERMAKRKLTFLWQFAG